MDVNVIIEHSLGFDLDSELGLCRTLALYGDMQEVREEFDPERARRLFQALLSTGRYADMDDHWRESVEAGVGVGTLARPEWN